VETKVFKGHGGISLMADVSGDPAEPAVVLLHGGGQTRHSWREAAKALAQAGRYVVSLDLRGHGESDWAPDGDYGIGAFALDLREVLRQLPRAGATSDPDALPALVGASLGGLTSLVAVGEAEEPIARALVLVDVTPQMDPEGIERITAFLRSAPHGFPDLDAAADAVSRFLPHRPRPQDTSGLSRNLRLRDGRYYWHWDPAFLDAEERLSPQHQLERLQAATRRVKIPTLQVRGALSEVVNDEAVKRFQSLMPHAEVLEVAGAAHMVPGDQNDVFNAAVLGFLERVARRPAQRAVETGFDARTLRNALGCFTTGVTVITTLATDGTPLGFTANSFSSVSLDPPLVLFCLDSRSSSLAALEAAGVFVVNVLHIGQQDVSNRFAKRGEDRFAQTPCEVWDTGVPVIKDSMASLECRTLQVLDGGDHRIFLGRVLRVRADPSRDPLLYLQGQYRRVHVPH
jgi:flavin reductase (DIM6/NTAB) family NADH-FMN oxidoreductase RutF/pimeloyl-ACP methyl ester carboxylesterase